MCTPYNSKIRCLQLNIMNHFALFTTLESSCERDDRFKRSTGCECEVSPSPCNTTDDFVLLLPDAPKDDASSSCTVLRKNSWSRTSVSVPPSSSIPSRAKSLSSSTLLELESLSSASCLPVFAALFLFLLAPRLGKLMSGVCFSHLPPCTTDSGGDFDFLF